ncbi:MATE family efflux transporter [Rhizomonospora bruguierae]|uniref:polysaccharide biosynthesis protein n=1 Tax=Rhizomonospora bruguierae TaxID=1581705 RepID=UPI001BCC0242|nr:polysaccharide biosynthesis protein [Micromonospora sp. NBRC 107566]
MRRLLRLLPPGTVAVGGGLAVLGVAAYVHLAIAGHTLDRADMSSVSVLWSIVFSIGPGLFFPIEQELARLVAARRVGNEPPGPVLRRGATLAGGLLIALIALTAAGSHPLADRLFGGDTGLVWALCGAFVGLALAHTTRGLLAGLGHFAWYGVQLGADGALRIGMAAAIGVLGIRSALWFSLVLVFAPVVSVLVTLPPVRRAIGPGRPIPWSALVRGLGLLTVSALLAQLVVNIAVVNVRLIAPGDVVVAGALLSALVLVRVPLFVFASLQASLLPGLATLVASGDRAGARRLLVRALAVVTALGVAGGTVAVALGPWLVRLLFDAPDVLTAADFAWLAGGTLAYLWAMVLGQGVLAQNRHRAQALAWVVGTAALVAATLAPLGVALRVELGYAVGSLVVAVAMAWLLARATPAARSPEVLAGRVSA